jgi:hypothetical protein
VPLVFIPEAAAAPPPAPKGALEVCGRGVRRGNELCAGRAGNKHKREYSPSIPLKQNAFDTKPANFKTRKERREERSRGCQIKSTGRRAWTTTTFG